MLEVNDRLCVQAAAINLRGGARVRDPCAARCVVWDASYTSPRMGACLPSLPDYIADAGDAPVVSLCVALHRSLAQAALKGAQACSCSVAVPAPVWRASAHMVEGYAWNCYVESTRP